VNLTAFKEMQLTNQKDKRLNFCTQQNHIAVRFDANGLKTWPIASSPFEK
jgi:phage-related protein